MSTKRYRVPVSWSVGAETVVEADSVEDAMDLATGMDLDTFDNVEYISDSFDIDEYMVEALANQIYAGMGVPKEFVDGSTTYSTSSEALKPKIAHGLLDKNYMYNMLRAEMEDLVNVSDPELITGRIEEIYGRVKQAFDEAFSEVIHDMSKENVSKNSTQ